MGWYSCFGGIQGMGKIQGMIAKLKEDVVSMGRDKTVYGKKGEKVTIIKEHEGVDGTFYLVEGKERFHTKKDNLLFNG